MNQLSDEQVATLVELLEAREQSLESVVRERVAHLSDRTAESPGDPADVAETDLVHDHESAAAARELRELQEIETARERLASNRAGVCADCGEPIGFERLLVQPAAVRCVFCQAIHEQTQLQVRGDAGTAA